MMFIKTVRDSEMFIDKVNDLHSLIYKSDTNVLKSMDKIFSEEEDEWLTGYLGLKDEKQAKSVNVSSKLEALIEEIRSLNVLIIEVARPLTTKQIDQISKWWDQNCSTKMLFDFVVNEEIVAGAVIKKDGKIKDYSLASTLTA